MRILLSVLFLAGMQVSAQSALSSTQLKTSTAVASPESYVLFALSNGVFRTVKIGTGLVLEVDQGSGQATLKSALQVPTVKVRRETTDYVPDAQGNFPAPDPDTAIFRNGILQRIGEDYTIGGTHLVPNPAAGWTLINAVDVKKDLLLAEKVVLYIQP